MPAAKSSKSPARKAKESAPEVTASVTGKEAKTVAKTVKKAPVRKKAPVKKPKPIDPDEALVRLCADAALDKKALDPVILDMRGISSFTDFFLIVSGSSEPQLKAIAASIRERVRESLGIRPIAEDGFPVSKWVIIDYGSVIIHVFHSEMRTLYGLEHLWGDAPRIDIPAV
jgi:ribosome-associated protein